MAGRVMRVLALTITLVVAPSSLVGCGGGSDDGSEPAVSERDFTPASDPAGLKDEGTEIADGVHVQPDSSLVGVAFPSLRIDGGVTAPSGWEAVVAIHGDPIDVWDDYVAELGIDDEASAPQACVVQARGEGETQDATETQRFLTEEALDDELRLWCHARIGATEVSMASGVVGCVRPNVSDDPCELRSGSSLFIQQARDDGGEFERGDALGTDELRRARAEASLPGDADEPDVAGRGEPVTPAPVLEEGDPVPSTTHVSQPPDRHPDPVAIPDGPIVRPEFQGVGPSNLPGPGERVDDGIDHFLGTSDEDWVAAPAILPEGAESLIAPSMLIDCNSGLVAVVEMPHEPEDAVAAFATDDPEGTTDVLTGKLGDRMWAARSFDSAGGFKLQYTAVSGDEDGSSYVLATECGD